MFNKDSIVVKVWYTTVLAGTSYKYKDVPNISNLREVVGELLTEFGYDITEPEVEVPEVPEG